MSTFSEIIDRVNQNKPNSFDVTEMVRWLTELDGKIATEVMMMSVTGVRNLPRGEETLNCEALVSFPYEDLYDRYLEAMIDYHNGEFSNYQNSMEAYNWAYNRFLNWYLNTYDPIQGYGGG